MSMGTQSSSPQVEATARLSIAIVSINLQGDAYVELAISGGDYDVSGHRLHAVTANKDFVFPAGSKILLGKRARVYTNKVDPETGGYSFGSPTAIWNPRGDVARLFNPAGVRLSELGCGEMPIRRDLDGLRVNKPSEAQIYLMDGGVKRWIPNPDTYGRLFRDWNGIVQSIDVDGIITGTPLTTDAALQRAEDDAAVYLVEGGVKRVIFSSETMDRYYLDSSKVQTVKPTAIASIRTGPMIVWPE